MTTMAGGRIMPEPVINGCSKAMRPGLRRLRLLLLLASVSPIASAADPTPPPPPSPNQSSTAPPAAPADAAAAAALEAMGSLDVRIHDPSSIIKCKDEYWVFYTGANVPSYRSKDLKHWEAGPRAFAAPPKWVHDAVPRNRNGNDFWAPEVIRLGDRYLLYYSVSSFGRNDSVIALATNATLDPADAAYRWIDEGIVIRSTADDNFNAIDPAASADADGKLWLTFGSFWGGIQLVELDPKSGKRLAADSPIHRLARQDQIEGPFIHRHDGKYYLFVAWGWCCRGVNSTYNTRVGRSDQITGPYLDRDGKDMRYGGGTLVAGTDGAFIGPGQPSVFSDAAKQDRLVCHFYDATRRGRGTLAIRPLNWDAEGWPALAPTDRGDERR
jgi:arabinan endo-1,5-alpha-L-arabinosidase